MLTVREEDVALRVSTTGVKVLSNAWKPWAVHSTTPIVVRERPLPTKVTYDSFQSLEVAVWLRTQVSLGPSFVLPAAF